VIKTGDTVRWVAEDGAILIRFFEGSPFASKETELRADSSDALNTQTPEKVVLGDGKTVESYKYTIVWGGVSEYSGRSNLLCDDPHIIIDNNIY
jgi:hypothetical protein